MLSPTTFTSYSVSATANPIRYHSTEARNLLTVTLDGLEGNGVSCASIGARRDGRFILSGGAYLTAHARSVLPIHMGGEHAVLPVGLDDRTIDFLDRANAMSPAGFKGTLHRPAHSGLGNHGGLFPASDP